MFGAGGDLEDGRGGNEVWNGGHGGGGGGGRAFMGVGG